MQKVATTSCKYRKVPNYRASRASPEPWSQLRTTPTPTRQHHPTFFPHPPQSPSQLQTWPPHPNKHPLNRPRRPQTMSPSTAATRGSRSSSRYVVPSLRARPPSSRTALTVAPTVRPIPREPVLPQPPSHPKAAHSPRVRRVPRLPAILDPSALPQVHHVPRPDAQAPRAAAAGAVPTGYH